MSDIYALIRNGMGDRDAGTGAKEDDLLYFSNYFLAQGGIIDTGDLVVTQRAAGANLSVDIAAGRVFIGNTDYVVNTDVTKYWAGLVTAASPVINRTITANSSGQDRIDIVVIRMDTTEVPDDNASNVIKIEVIAGTPDASPVAPTTPDNAYKLAEISVVDGATLISNSDITDSRDLAYIDLGRSLVPYQSKLLFKDSTGAKSNWFQMRDATHFDLKLGVANEIFSILDNSGNAIASFGGASRVMDANYGTKIRALKNDNTDHIDMYFDGNGRIDTSAGDVILKAFSNIVRTYAGSALQIRSTNDAQNGKLSHDNTSFLYDTTTTHVFRDSGLTNRLVINGATMTISSSVVPSAANTYNLGSLSNYYQFSYTEQAYIDVIASLTTGHVDVTADFRMTGGSSAAVSAYNTGSTKHAFMQHNDSYAIFGTSSNSVKIQTAANGDVVIFTRFMRRWQSTSTYNEDFGQRGGGYIQGDGSAAISRTHTFNRAFGNDNVTVVASFTGARATASGTPSDEGDLGGSGNFTVAVTDVTASNVLVTIERSAGTFSGSTYYGYSLIAWGPN